MKSKFYYLFTIIIAICFSACVPPTDGSGKATPSGPFGAYGTFIFMGMIIVVFWMFFIRPQNKRQKQQKTFLEGLQKGDKVVTVAGIHGTINKINEDGTVILETSPGSYIKMEKTSISMEMTSQLNKAGTTTDKK